MTIVILAVGSEGDVRPLLALGRGLAVAGYDVRVATHRQFEDSVRELGLSFSPITVNPKEVFDSEAGQAALRRGRYHEFVRATQPYIAQGVADCRAACDDADAVVHSPFGWYAGPHICEERGVPGISVQFQPIDPTRSFPSFLSPTQRSLGAVLNPLTYPFADALFWLPYRSIINRWRREQLGLPPLGLRFHQQLRRRGYCTLYAFSSHVVPKPPDWGDHITVTGYWFLDGSQDWRPPSELVDFLAAGPPPVYIGFGSISSRSPEETTKMVLDALVIAKQRAVLGSGWGGLSGGDLPTGAFRVAWVPHSWLLPQMAAVIHHGGAGTTGAVLRAGVPSVVIPHVADQPFWARRVADLGVGPEPLPRRHLSAERLATAITTAVSGECIRHRAAALGERIAAEDGVANAVEVVKRVLAAD